MDRTAKEREVYDYNRTAYSLQWLNSSDHRLASDYYKRDHYQDTMETLLALKGTRVLECGIGTGEFFALNLAKSGKSIYGIDFSGILLNDCKTRFAKEDQPVRLGMADLQRIPFKSETFDITYSMGVIVFVKDLEMAIQEMVRVTKRGGIVMFDMMNLWHPSQVINYWYRCIEASRTGFAAIRFLKNVKRRFGFTTNFKTAPDKVGYRLISPAAVIRILKRMPVIYKISGYNVLLSLDLPILGKHANLCTRFPLFAHGLKNHKILKYFGAKLVITMEKA